MISIHRAFLLGTSVREPTNEKAPDGEPSGAMKNPAMTYFLAKAISSAASA